MKGVEETVSEEKKALLIPRSVSEVGKTGGRELPDRLSIVRIITSSGYTREATHSQAPSPEASPPPPR